MKVYHEDLEYAKFACEAYKKFRDSKNIFYIGKEIYLESRIEIKEANNWVEQVTNKEQITNKEQVTNKASREVILV